MNLFKVTLCRNVYAVYRTSLSHSRDKVNKIPLDFHFIYVHAGRDSSKLPTVSSGEDLRPEANVTTNSANRSRKKLGLLSKLYSIYSFVTILHLALIKCH